MPADIQTPPAPAPGPAERGRDRALTTGTVGPTHRADIQGLRAIAVLMVVAFHAGLDVPGGFVGVDVFFVISGFVITAMLAREFERSHRIGLGRFYKRRFRRLTPALALMVAVTLLVAMPLLSPFGPLQRAAKTGLGAMLLSANYAIAATTGNYFDPPAETNPLLHTWSLSVEEQFYLVFPLILFAGWALARRHGGMRQAPLVLVTGLAGISFVGAMASAAGAWPDHWLFEGFYSPFTRAWEFAVGAILALVAHRLPRVPSGATTFAAVVGAAMLIASLWLIDGTTPFPGPWALLPVVGTLLVLAAGTVRINPVSLSLAARPLVRIGDLSYSIYLWHWPCIVFAALIWPGSTTATILAAAVAFLPAVLSYRRLEQPIRRRPDRSRAQFAALVTVVMVPTLLVCVGTLYLAGHVIEPRLLSGDLGRVEYHGAIGWDNLEDMFHRFHKCADPELRDARESGPDATSVCLQSRPDAKVDVVIMGDSHAMTLFPGLAEALPDHNVLFYDASGVPTADNDDFAPVFDYLERSTDDQVVVLSSYYTRPISVDQYVRSVRALAAAGKQVFFTDDIPDFPFNPIRCKYQGLLTTRCTESASVDAHQRARFVDTVTEVARRVPGVAVLPTARYFCGGEECSMTRGRDLLYRDPSHLNFRGSRILGAKLAADPRLRAALGDPRTARAAGPTSTAVSDRR